LSRHCADRPADVVGQLPYSTFALALEQVDDRA
jgi:hypothetical protein